MTNGWLNPVIEKVADPFTTTSNPGNTNSCPMIDEASTVFGVNANLFLGILIGIILWEILNTEGVL